MNAAAPRNRPPLLRAITPRALLIGGLALLALGASALSASAHGFSSVVFADIAEGSQPGHVAVELQLEYDLLAVSAADAQQDDGLFDEGTYAFELGDDETRAMVLQDHEDAVLGYIADRFTLGAEGAPCTPAPAGDITMTVQEDAPYAVIPLDFACDEESEGHLVTSTLFADAEGYVTGTTTILTYEVDGHSGSAALDQDQTSFSTAQSLGERFGEFFLLGAEHLLFGIDHILFLLALIAGSRRLREIVLAATAFTVAHSITFILAAVGVVSVPAAVIEPIIAISISIVAAWYLFRLATDRNDIDRLEKTAGPLGLDRAGWIRLAVVFVFGLVHGLGFASALGIDEPWSWTLLWSLLVFNVGIEAVQIGIIVVVFPLLVLLRRHWPRLGMWITGILAAAVTVVGLVWFVERLLGA
ncbi:HupE/UreJ family protein [Microbacterium tumbae]